MTAGNLAKRNLVLYKDGLLPTGVWPYLMGVRLNCRNYAALVALGIRVSVYDRDMLELREGDKVVAIGLTPALRQKLIRT